MTLNDTQLAGLYETFHIRAETYMRKAKEAVNPRDARMSGLGPRNLESP